MPEDWAEVKAREWLKSMRLTPRYYVPSLVALLREARPGEYKCPECGALTIQSADQYKRELLAVVRREVEETSWPMCHCRHPSHGKDSRTVGQEHWGDCGEQLRADLLARLEKL